MGVARVSGSEDMKRTEDYFFFFCPKGQGSNTNTGVKERTRGVCSVHQIHILSDDV